MTLPVPRLDDRSFQDLVNEAKRLIPRYCPEWTDHNVSDPGVTLIELFAYLVDILLYRVNRVPLRNYIKWLEMLGLKLEPPRPARVDVTFYLSGPQPEPITLPAGTEVATVRTESQQAIVFSTDHDLTINVPTLQGLVAHRARTYHDYLPALADPTLDVGIFQDPPQPNDALYFGYHQNLNGHILLLTLDSHIEGIGVKPDDPPLAWEYWDGLAEEWAPMYLERDTTGGLNRPGEVIVHVPFAATPRDLDGRIAFWIRCRATPPRPDQPAYSSAPRIHKVKTDALGGIVAASQVEAIAGEVLGRSTGKPGQEWQLSNPPVLARQRGELLEVEQEDGSFDTWLEVPDWADSGPADHHYMLDSQRGVLCFGPSVRDAAGRVVQCGAYPPEGRLLRFRRYRTGGGTQGNVGKHTITVLRSSIPYVARVTNGLPAVGGEDAESLEMALLRAPNLLRARTRAVTCEDYEFLARQASPEVARARCIPPTAEALAAGRPVVRLLLVPATAHTDALIPFQELRLGDRARVEIMSYLNERRLVTSQVQLDPPDYVHVSIEVTVGARKRESHEELAHAIRRALYAYLNPVFGGPDRAGWPWERSLFPSEVITMVQQVAGVEYVAAVRLVIVDPPSGARSPVEGAVRCPAHGLLASAEHRVSIL